MTESEHSFIVISPNNKKTGSVHSIDGWSEISVPSNRSNSLTKQSLNIFSVMTVNVNVVADTNSDNGYYLIDLPVIQLTNSTPSQPKISTTKNIPNHPNESISSVGSRVPFSWAEIAKIQPKFQGDNNNKSKPKVFDQTPKIRTRFPPNAIKKIKNGSLKLKMQIGVGADNKNNEDLMPCIPETKPIISKVRKAGKRGSRLRYPNGRRGSKRNWRKKNHK